MAPGSSFRSSLRGERRFGNDSLTSPPFDKLSSTVPYQPLSPQSSTCDPSSLASGSQYDDSTCYETEGSADLSSYSGTAHITLPESCFPPLSKDPRLNEIQPLLSQGIRSNPKPELIAAPDGQSPRVSSLRKASKADTLFSFYQKLSDGSTGLFRKLSDGSEAFVRKLSAGSTEIARRLSDGSIGSLRRIIPKSAEPWNLRSFTNSKVATTPSLSPETEKPKKRGRRTSGKPLSLEQKKNFSQLRKLGVCICCKRNKTQCSEGRPCHHCDEKDIPCERIGKERLIVENIDKVMSAWDSELKAMVEANKIYSVGSIRLMGRLNIPESVTSQNSKLSYTQQVEMIACFRSRHRTFGLNDDHMNAFMQKLPEIFELPGVPSWADISGEESTLYDRARECAGYFVLLQSLLYKDSNIVCLCYDQIKDHKILLTFATSLITWTTNKLVEGIKSIVKEAIKSLLKDNHRKDGELLALALVTAIHSHGESVPLGTFPRSRYLSNLQTQLKSACGSDLSELERLGRCFFVNNFKNVKGKKKEIKLRPHEDFDELVGNLRSKLPFISLTVSYENDSAKFGVDAMYHNAHMESPDSRKAPMPNLNLHSYKPESYPKMSFWCLFDDFEEFLNFGPCGDDSNGYEINREPLSLHNYHGFETPSTSTLGIRRDSIHIGPCNESDQPAESWNSELNDLLVEARAYNSTSQFLTAPSIENPLLKSQVPMKEEKRRPRKRGRIPSIEEHPEESGLSPIWYHRPSPLCGGVVNEGNWLHL